MSDIIAIGEALIDFTEKEKDKDGYPTLAAHPGGAPANFLAAAGKCGLSTALYSKVGNDTFGNLLIKTISEAGIDVSSLIKSDDVFTTLAFVTLDAEGDRTFSFARKPGADTCIEYDELDLSLLENAGALHFGTLSLTNDPSRSTTVKLVELAKAKGKLITFDPNLREPLWDSLDEAKKQMLWGIEKADIVKISLEEIDFLFSCSAEAGARKLVEDYGCKLVFATLGKNGCYYYNKTAEGHIDNYNDVVTVDTTGAGDIFGGTAIAGVLKSGIAPEELTKDMLDRIVRFACAAASLSTASFGGISSVPENSEVEKLIAEN